MIKKSLLVVTYAALMGSAALAVVYNADGPIPSSDYIVSDDEPTDTQRIAPLFGAGQGEARAVMMIRNGIETAKRYAPGYSNQTRFISWSMAKSVTAVLVGEMVADGTLKLDAPVPFAEWQKPGDPRREITLQQMLHMSSGLDHQEGMDPKDGPAGVLKSDTTRILFVQADQPMAAAALKAGLRAKPGTLYDYSSLTSLLLAELITRQLTDSKDPHVRAAAYKAFAEERLFKPAGITSAFMEFDSAGTQIGGSIIYMTLDDWGRFGQLLIAGKGSDDSQAIAPDWLTFLRTPSKTDTGYGGHMWLNRPRSGGEANHLVLFPGQGPDSTFAAVGHLGQYVIVSPDQGLVLVRLGKTNDGEVDPVRRALGNVIANAK